jgi:hypothetical protein
MSEPKTNERARDRPNRPRFVGYFGFQSACEAEPCAAGNIPYSFSVYAQGECLPRQDNNQAGASHLPAALQNSIRRPRRFFANTIVAPRTIPSF